MLTYDGVGILHNLAMEHFGQGLVSIVRKEGTSSITAKTQRRLILDALNHALRQASRYLPAHAGAKVTMAGVNRLIAAQAKASKPPREAFGGRLPREAVRDIAVLNDAMRSLGGRRLSRSFIATITALEKKYKAKKESAVTQTMLVGVAIARHSADYWRQQSGAKDGWVSRLVRQVEATRPPVKPGTGAARLIDRIRKWFRDHWPDISFMDRWGAVYGAIYGIALLSVPTLILGGMIGGAAASLVTAVGLL